MQGCLLSSTTAQTVNRNLLSNDMTGEGIRIFDIKVAKNIRFGSRRLNLGMDLYNAFNSDAAMGYCEAFPACGDTPPSQWMRVFQITAPRYARFQVQFDF